MGRAGRHERDDLAYETFDGARCSSVGYSLSWRHKQRERLRGRVIDDQRHRCWWQATLRVEREGKKVRRNVGTFGAKGEAAVQRALAIAG